MARDLVLPTLPHRPDTKPITRPVAACQGTLSRLDTVLPAVVMLGASGQHIGRCRHACLAHCGHQPCRRCPGWSTISPQLAQTKERRSARATVREKLGEVDALRWSGESYLDFRRATVALESAAIMARVPRKSVQRYIKAAVAARQASEILPVGPEGELDGAVDTAHDQAVMAALDDVSRRLWHPWVAMLVHHLGNSPAGHLLPASTAHWPVARSVDGRRSPCPARAGRPCRRSSRPGARRQLLGGPSAPSLAVPPLGAAKPCARRPAESGAAGRCAGPAGEQLPT